MDFVKALDNNVNSILQNYLQKPTIIKGIVHLLLILYVARLAPVPPASVLILFDNIYFKLFVFSLVLWTAQFSPATSVLIALAFMVTINYTTRGKFGINGVYELMDNVPMTPINSLQAIHTLASMAASPEPVPSSIVDPMKNMAMAGVSTPAEIKAIDNLSIQATMNVAGTSQNVANAVNTASISILSSMPSPIQSIQAVKSLGDAAISPISVDKSTVLPVANIVMAGISTKSAMTSVQNLTTQAMSSSPGDPIKITADVNNIMSNINNATVSSQVSTPMTPITSAPTLQAKQSIQALAQGAASNTSMPSEMVNPVANIAISAMSSQNGIDAIKSLAGQSMTPAAGDPTRISSAVQTAMVDMSNSSTIMPATTSVASTPAPVGGESAKQIEPANGCYPIRHNDMKGIMPMKDGDSSFEDYQEFKSTMSSS